MPEQTDIRLAMKSKERGSGDSYTTLSMYLMALTRMLKNGWNVLFKREGGRKNEAIHSKHTTLQIHRPPFHFFDKPIPFPSGLSARLFPLAWILSPFLFPYPVPSHPSGLSLQLTSLSILLWHPKFQIGPSVILIAHGSANLQRGKDWLFTSGYPKPCIELIKI